MTKVLTDSGWVSYVAVIDWYTREELGSAIGLKGDTKLWLEALNKALINGYEDGVRGKGVKLVSDNGSQPTSRRFMEECKTLGIHQIFTSYNNPKGNAKTERFFKTYKEEVVWPNEVMSFSELKRKTEEFQIYYNEEYQHSSLGYKSPREYYEEEMRLQKIA